jgi:hypothetical protein
LRSLALPHHHFTNSVLPSGNLPTKTFGRLVAEFKFASHIPLAGGQDTGRHIYLALSVPSGQFAGLYEAAVNIRSDEGTEVKFADKLENVNAADVPKPGFQAGVKLAYGAGPDGEGVDFLGLADGDFQDIENDELYDKVSKLTEGCDLVAVDGVTYGPPKNNPHGKANGIHDVHMNSGTDPGDSHAGDDRDHEDGAVAFYFNLGNGQAFAHWVFVKFASQTVVNS